VRSPCPIATLTGFCLRWDAIGPLSDLPPIITASPVSALPDETMEESQFDPQMLAPGLLGTPARSKNPPKARVEDRVIPADKGKAPEKVVSAPAVQEKVQAVQEKVATTPPPVRRMIGPKQFEEIVRQLHKAGMRMVKIDKGPWHQLGARQFGGYIVWNVSDSSAHSLLSQY
jgi:hypothetical protein